MEKGDNCEGLHRIRVGDQRMTSNNMADLTVAIGLGPVYEGHLRPKIKLKGLDMQLIPKLEPVMRLKFKPYS